MTIFFFEGCWKLITISDTLSQQFHIKSLKQKACGHRANLWPACPNCALSKITIMIDFLFKFFTIIEDHSIYTSLRNANNTQTDKTVTVQWLLLCSTNNTRKKLSCVAQDLSIVYTQHTSFSRTLNLTPLILCLSLIK